VEMQPTLDHLGEMGQTLLMKYAIAWICDDKLNRWLGFRFVSTSVGFRFLYDSGYIDREMEVWFNVSDIRNIIIIYSKFTIGTKPWICGSRWSISGESVQFF
jgi:large subunit ribosomal protein L17e